MNYSKIGYYVIQTRCCMKNCATISSTLTMTNEARQMIDLKTAISRLRGIVKYLDQNYSSHGLVNTFYDINDDINVVEENKGLLCHELCVEHIDFLTRTLPKTITYQAQIYCENMLERGNTPFPQVLKLATSQVQTLKNLEKVR